MDTLTKDDFTTVEHIVAKVELPELKKIAYVRELTGKDLDAWERFIIEVGARPEAGHFAGVRARLVMLTACDADGARLFTDNDIDAVNGMCVSVLSLLYDAAAKMNELDEENPDASLEGEDLPPDPDDYPAAPALAAPNGMPTVTAPAAMPPEAIKTMLDAGGAMMGATCK